MAPRDNVWVAQRGYTPLTGCEIKGDVVIIAQWGSGGAPTKQGSTPPTPPTLPANRLLTEADESIMQENSDYLLLDIG